MKKLIGLGLALTPYSTFAAEDLKGLIIELINLINLVIPLLFGIALLGFMIGVIKYIASGSAEKIKEARLYIVYSVVAIAVMLSIWSLALFLKNSFFPRGPMPYNPTGGGGSGGGSVGGGSLPLCAGDYNHGARCNKPGGGFGTCDRVDGCI
ncbi:MAG: hypothetical protein M3Q73_01700 [bacterium]|nr:hypothetical protein [bacterium]